MKFNEDLFFNSIIQLLISIVIGTIVLYSSYKLIEKFIRKKHEIEIDKIDKVRGLDITFVTSAETDDEARSLLRHLGMPFRK